MPNCFVIMTQKLCRGYESQVTKANFVHIFSVIALCLQILQV